MCEMRLISKKIYKKPLYGDSADGSDMTGIVFMEKIGSLLQQKRILLFIIGYTS